MLLPIPTNNVCPSWNLMQSTLAWTGRALIGLNARRQLRLECFDFQLRIDIGTLSTDQQHAPLVECSFLACQLRPKVVARIRYIKEFTQENLVCFFVALGLSLPVRYLLRTVGVDYGNDFRAVLMVAGVSLKHVTKCLRVNARARHLVILCHDFSLSVFTIISTRR